MKRRIKIALFAAGVGVLIVMLGCSSIERRLLFYPSHRASPNGLEPWKRDGEIIGFSRPVAAPKNVWLMLHGNAGQAADRAYALSSFSPDDSVFILEYPGYGRRPGVPSMASFNAAAEEAYRQLRKDFPQTPVCVVSESIGAGPACHLATLKPPPEKIALIAPFNTLSGVARDHFPDFLVKAILRQNWDNGSCLAHFKGPVDIFAAAEDTIISPRHAKSLAESIPHSSFVLVEGGHNDWSFQDNVKIRHP